MGFEYQNSTSGFNRNGWIFSPRHDAILFWSPTLIAALTSVFVSAETLAVVSPIHLWIGHVAFNFGHVWATGAPVYRRSSFTLSQGLLLGAPILFVGILYSLFAVRPSYFHCTLAAIAVFHIFRQQHGWLLLSRRRAQEPEYTAWLDKLMLWTLMTVPVMWWLSPLSTGNKFYFRPGDLPVSVPPILVWSAVFAYIAIAIFYFYHTFILAKGRPLNLGKLSVFGSTLIWYASLFIMPSQSVFFPALFYIHGGSYILHCRRDLSRPPVRISRRLIFMFPFVVALLGLASYFMSPLIEHLSKIQIAEGEALAFFLGLPLILHYYFDSFIWRRKFDVSGSSPALVRG